mmetsp:Transcript_28433/g.55671  ORF Transcript_28433/g.55671 Transcript_28433/m.55671 type:complete len:204 (-) Transcript_28433:237-848(-)
MQTTQKKKETQHGASFLPLILSFYLPLGHSLAPSLPSPPHCSLSIAIREGLPFFLHSIPIPSFLPSCMPLVNSSVHCMQGRSMHSYMHTLIHSCILRYNRKVDCRIKFVHSACTRIPSIHPPSCVQSSPHCNRHTIHYLRHTTSLTHDKTRTNLTTFSFSLSLPRSVSSSTASFHKVWRQELQRINRGPSKPLEHECREKEAQ